MWLYKLWLFRWLIKNNVRLDTTFLSVSLSLSLSLVLYSSSCTPVKQDSVSMYASFVILKCNLNQCLSMHYLMWWCFTHLHRVDNERKYSQVYKKGTSVIFLDRYFLSDFFCIIHELSRFEYKLKASSPLPEAKL